MYIMYTIFYNILFSSTFGSGLIVLGRNGGLLV